MLLVKALLWSPAIQIIVLAAGILISFLIAFSRGDVNLYLPFISETGAYTPEMCIFSFFLYLGSLIGFFIIGLRFLLILQQREDSTFTRINYVSFVIGIFSMLGLAGVAAFPMTTVFWAHLVAAGVYFFGSALYFACSTLMTWKTEGRSKKFIFRCVLTVNILILLFILMICFPISLQKWHEFNSIIPALKEPTNKGFGMILLCSILEWSVVAIIVAYTFTFMSEMKNQGLHLTIAPVKNESDSAMSEMNLGLHLTRAPVKNESDSAMSEMNQGLHLTRAPVKNESDSALQDCSRETKLPTESSVELS